MSSLVEVENLYKNYDQGLVRALQGVDVTLEIGNIYALKGSSGCGKSTLLNLIGTLDKPCSGQILYEGCQLNELGPLHKFRSDFIGFVFQFHHLIPVLTLCENVEVALFGRHELSSKNRKDRALQVLDAMGLSHRVDFYANKISGGERQRAAIARAIVNKPKLVLADEPTGNVDSITARTILDKMQHFVIENGSTMLIATHDSLVASTADVVIEMEDGKIV